MNIEQYRKIIFFLLTEYMVNHKQSSFFFENCWILSIKFYSNNRKILSLKRYIRWWNHVSKWCINQFFRCFGWFEMRQNLDEFQCFFTQPKATHCDASLNLCLNKKKVLIKWKKKIYTQYFDHPMMKWYVWGIHQLEKMA